MITVIMTLMVCLLVVSISCATNTPTPHADWKDHLDIIVPGVMYAIKSLFWFIGILGSAIGILIGIGLKAFIRKNNAIASDIELIKHVMIDCDGCKESLEKHEKYGRRADDILGD